MEKDNLNQRKIGIIGLGYVGLPLAIAFSNHFSVIGFDINQQRVTELNKGKDKTDEANLEALKKALEGQLQLTSSEQELASCSIFIVTVPTPITEFKTPDLSFLKSASTMIGGILKKGDIVIYESTVYPGCTEEDCVPVLEHISGLQFNRDFFCGYSPERINPGDKINTLEKIMKVTSGSTTEVAEIVDELYQKIITAGTHKAPSIKVAEASKAIENAQRDLNISFMNELALIFDKMDIDTHDVLAAAGTKWNFLPFKPGLVGGHCISVDPYYLAHKAETLGYYPEVILSGRRVNDNMGLFVANKVVKLMNKKEIPVRGSKALIMGITFKENCPDTRNSKVPDIYEELKSFGIDVDVHDSHATPSQVKEEYAIDLTNTLDQYDAIILAVAHIEYRSLDIKKLKRNSTSVVYDIKGILDINDVDARL